MKVGASVHTGATANLSNLRNKCILKPGLGGCRQLFFASK